MVNCGYLWLTVLDSPGFKEQRRGGVLICFVIRLDLAQNGRSQGSSVENLVMVLLVFHDDG